MEEGGIETTELPSPLKSTAALPYYKKGSTIELHSTITLDWNEADFCYSKDPREML